MRPEGAPVSSKRHQRRKGCAGKVRHATKQIASQAWYRLQRKGVIVQIYQCRHCGHWHLGHQRAKDTGGVSGDGVD